MTKEEEMSTDKPECFGSGQVRIPQSAAENSCYDCNYLNECMVVSDAIQTSHYGNTKDNPLSKRQQQAAEDIQELINQAPKVFPEDDAERAKYPIGTFITEYFPNALAALAKHSWESNEKHSPGEPVHWAKDKSIGNIDRVFRHLIDGEKIHAAWRILELIEREITN